MHILSVDQFSRQDVEEFCQRAEALRRTKKTNKAAQGKLLANLFYEASTRTSSSFHAAMHKLSGNVLPINDVNYSSVSKGENLEDTIRTLSCYADVIVLRHPEIGAAKRASLVSTVPIINAGDGAGEHPTQALLDFYTIWREQEELEGITVTLMGDLKHGRTVHSLAKLLRLWNVKLNFVSPPELGIPREYKRDGDGEAFDLNEFIRTTDVLYMTRVQKERFVMSEVPILNLSYELTLEHMSRAKETLTLMHPLPRNEEIPSSIDVDPRAAYFRQMENGLWMRTVLLEKVLTQV
jgi:aspartate carbamoyltransferase catalytic subunit